MLKYDVTLIDGRFRITQDGEVAKRDGKEIDEGGYFEEDVVRRKVRSLNAAATRRKQDEDL